MIRPVIDCVLDWIVLIAIDNKKVHKSFISMVGDIVARCCLRRIERFFGQSQSYFDTDKLRPFPRIAVPH